MGAEREEEEKGCAPCEYINTHHESTVPRIFLPQEEVVWPGQAPCTVPLLFSFQSSAVHPSLPAGLCDHMKGPFSSMWPLLPRLWEPTAIPGDYPLHGINGNQTAAKINVVGGRVRGSATWFDLCHPSSKDGNTPWRVYFTFLRLISWILLDIPELY